MNELCSDCLDHQATVLAVRKLPSGKPLCDLHWRARLGMKPLGAPVLNSVVKKLVKSVAVPEEATMAERKVIDWSEVQKERDAGTAVADLVETYGVSNFTIYQHTKGNGKRAAPANGKKLAGGASKVALETPEADSPLRLKLDVSVKFLDAVWGGLSPEGKAALLSKLD